MSSCPSRRQWLNCWTLLLFLGVASCGDGGSDPSDAAEIRLDQTDVTLVAVGQTQQLDATVLDSDGNEISDADVDWTTGDPAIVSVSDEGLLIAQGPGTADVTASVGAVSATAAIIVQSTAALEVFEGNGQTAPPSTAVPTAPAVRVRDVSDDPVPGVQVRFEVVGASGSVTGETQTTDASGIARVGSWRLGASGVNTLTASVEGAQVNNEPVEFVATTAASGGYDITIRYLGEYSNAQLLAFAQAELRWESLITGDLTDVSGTISANDCGSNPQTSGPFDDLFIFVTLDSIDGPFGVLGQAGPCAIRVGSSVVGDSLTVIGRMEFDVEDMELLESEGVLEAVILHEMGHVLGFGTLWDALGFLQDPADPDTPPLEDPHFTGAQAIAAFNAAGGTTYTGAKVPVMNVGDPGTINSHWRDEVFDPELMTGFLNVGSANPLSAISVQSLGDMGYTVSTANADPFTLSSSFRITEGRRGVHLVDDVIDDPIRLMAADGHVVGVIRR